MEIIPPNQDMLDITKALITEGEHLSERQKDIICDILVMCMNPLVTVEGDVSIVPINKEE